MSTATEETPHAPAPEAAAAPSAKSGTAKLVGVIAAVMLLEGAGLYFLLGKGHSSHGEKAEGEHGAAAASHEAAPESDTVEVGVDTFMCTNNKASPGSIIHITFRLVAIIPTAQQIAFEKAANGEHKARVRQAVVKVARATNMEDLSDPDLSTMKRLFREEINKVLRKSYVVEVVVSDFKTIEQ